eukprot:TRINITY_DN3762_c0_g5_i1.p1 TRINITY_DN3762_c0_g5~~TRINITY_DN3762_c0_g5_i1.p1  ORF type:complete len:504 (-),score=116.15 TRINITY_DN3762_c0_g5_i1:80-1591(-)
MLAIVVLSAFVAFAMSYAIGANDVANAIGTAVGSRCLNMKSALILGGIFEFAGGVSLGYKVSDTLREKIIDTDAFIGQEELYIVGMFAALIGSSLWLLFATYYGLPVSTTHTIVSGILAFGISSEGIEAAKWDQIGFIVLSWVTSPVLGALVAYSIMYPLHKHILSDTDHAEAKTRRFIPAFFGGTLFVLIVFLVIETVESDSFPVWAIVLLGLGIGLLAWILIDRFFFDALISLSARLSSGMEDNSISDPLLMKDSNQSTRINMKTALQHAETEYRRAADTLSDAHAQDSVVGKTLLDGVDRVTNQLRPFAGQRLSTVDTFVPYVGVERMFVVLQIVTACFVAFSHGANDVANAMGPFAGILSVYNNDDVTYWDDLEWYIPVVASIAIIIGLGTMGQAVIATVGEKVTKLTPSKGFVALLAAALTVTAATLLGIPVSTTHTIVGSITGVGLIHGWASVDVQVLRNIFGSWVLTIPAGFLGTLIAFLLMVGADRLWTEDLVVL